MKVLEALYQSHRTGATVSPLPSQPQDG
jgi:hypothetical protein